MSYGDLHRRANQISHLLRARGITRGDAVGIYSQRNPALVWSILGVLRAGAAFVILDASYPRARLRHYVDAARVKVILDVTSIGDPPMPLAKPLCGAENYIHLSDAMSDALRSMPTTDVAVDIQRDDLAYIAFTSGSTGQPKAIAGTHEPLSHFIHWHCAQFGFGREDRFSMLSGLAHDPLLRDIFTPLSVGAQICIPPRGVFSDQHALIDWLAGRQVTVAHLTPTLARILTAGAAVARLPELRFAFFGGEPLPVVVASAFRGLAPGVACVNFYGATETPQAMAFCVFNEQLHRDAPTVPIGHGITGAQILVLRPDGSLAESGETGEICIRTPYLSNGYPNDPAATAARFVRNPFRTDPADRMYRTGDLGRYLEDGDVECLGRLDRQVKIRGVRVEPAEIEAALLALSGVSAAAVTSKDSPSGTRLIAWVVSAGAHLDVVRLRRGLETRLPRQAVPDEFVPVGSIPLTPNGKLDYAALEATERLPQRSDSFSGPLERTVARIWKDVLHLSSATKEQNFFDCGGSSLSAAQFAGAIEKALGYRLPLMTLLQSPTLGAVIERVRLRDSAESWSFAVPLRRTGSKSPLFCVHPIGGNLLCYRMLVANIEDDRPIWGLQARGLDGQTPPHTDIVAMASDYVSAIRAIQPAGPYHLCGYSAGGLVAFEMARQIRQRGEIVDALLLLDTGVGVPTEVFSRNLKNIRNLFRSGDLPAFLARKVINVKMRLKLAVFGIAERLGQPLPPSFLNVEEAFLLARKNYTPVDHGQQATLIRASLELEDHHDPSYGWSAVLSDKVNIRFVPATHDNILYEPSVIQVAREIGSILTGALTLIGALLPTLA